MEPKKPVASLAVKRMMMTIGEGYDLNPIYNCHCHCCVYDKSPPFFLFEKCHAVWFSLETSAPQSAACRSNQLALHVDRFASPSEFPHISEETKNIADLSSELQ